MRAFDDYIVNTIADYIEVYMSGGGFLCSLSARLKCSSVTQPPRIMLHSACRTKKAKTESNEHLSDHFSIKNTIAQQMPARSCLTLLVELCQQKMNLYKKA